jgi:branched-chain amino acid transport system substrate-binding protein
VPAAPKNCHEKKEVRIMKLTILRIISIAAIAGGPLATAASNDVVIGDIDDLTGVYSDNGGAGAIEAIRMAKADFGGGASKAREWTDQRGLNMLLGGANTGVAIAMAKVMAAKKVPYKAVKVMSGAVRRRVPRCRPRFPSSPDRGGF